MRTNALFSLIVSIAASIVTGCGSTPSASQVIRAPGPEGTVVYEVPVDASEPGARIEVNGESMGTTPMVLNIFGDRDGTFHNFGSYDYIVRAHPPGTGRRSVTKVYRTGALMAKEDRIPDKIYFDFGPNPQPSN
jgi:hypothetical protein